MIAHVLNSEGTRFTLRLVMPGDAYGTDYALTHEGKEPMLEFYDAAHPFAHLPNGMPLGQFVARYYTDRLLVRGSEGLDLDGGVPRWFIDASAMCIVRALIMNWLGDDIPSAA